MTVTVVLLVGLGFLTSALVRPFVPVPPPNFRALQHGDYLAKNAQAQIKWEPYGPEPLDRAKALNKPILLTIGRWGSPPALHLDREVLSDPEVAEQINRSFVPMRVDLDEDPEWQGVILPLQKAALMPEPGFEMAVLSPEGRLISWTAKRTGGDRLDFSGIVDLLSRARRAALTDGPLLQEDQESEAGQIKEMRSLLPEGGQIQDLARALEDGHGILNESGKTALRPWVWRGLASGGYSKAALESVLAWTESPLMDPVGCSFYSSAALEEQIKPEPVKLLEPNLDTMAFLAQASRVLGRSDLAFLSLQMAEGIEREFLSERLPASALVGQVQDQPGSNRFAFKTGEFWGKLSPREQEVLKQGYKTDFLSASPFHPEARSLQTLLAPSEELQAVRSKLLGMRLESPPERSGAVSTESVATAASRMMLTGALLDRPDLESRGRTLLNLAESAWKKGNVEPLLNRPARVHSLTSALTLLEAYLTLWNLTGEEEAKAKGVKLLGNILARHQGEDGHVSAPPFGPPLPLSMGFDLNSLDGATRSDAALLIELLSCWAVIAQDPRLADLAEVTHGRWRGLGLLAAPGWMGLFDAFVRGEKPPLEAESREDWIKAVSRGFDRYCVRKAPTLGKTQGLRTPSPSE